MSPPAGTQTWSDLTWIEFYDDSTSSEPYTNTSSSVSWVGTLDSAYPDDFSASYSTTNFESFEMDAYSTEEWNSAGCEWSRDSWTGGATEWDEGDYGSETLTFDGLSAIVYFWDGECGVDFWTYTATFDGVHFGEVDGSTWAYIGADLDEDGWSTESGDPDDEDASVFECVLEEEEEEEDDDDDESSSSPTCSVIGGGMSLGLAWWSFLAISRRRR